MLAAGQKNVIGISKYVRQVPADSAQSDGGDSTPNIELTHRLIRDQGNGQRGRIRRWKLGPTISAKTNSQRIHGCGGKDVLFLKGQILIACIRYPSSARQRMGERAQSDFLPEGKIP